MNTEYPVDERNQMIIDFFKHHNIEVKLIGDKNKPKIVVNDDQVLSGFVYNKKFNFTTKQFGGDVIYVINLHRLDFYKTSFINKLIDNNNKTKIYRIKQTEIPDVDSYYLKTDEATPIFSENDSRYYFNKLEAEKTKLYLFNVHKIFAEVI